MPGEADSSGPWALFAYVAIEVKRIRKSLQVCDHSDHCIVLPKKKTCRETLWPEYKTPLLEHRIRKSSWLYKSKHQVGHNHSRYAASLKTKKLTPPSPPPPQTKSLQEMLRKWQSRGGWPSGEWCHPLCSLLFTREKEGLELLNAHGNEIRGKPRIY